MVLAMVSSALPPRPWHSSAAAVPAIVKAIRAMDLARLGLSRVARRVPVVHVYILSCGSAAGGLGRSTTFNERHGQTRASADSAPTHACVPHAREP